MNKKYAERFSRRKQHIVFFLIAILFSEELCALGNCHLVPKKMFVVFMFPFHDLKHNFVTVTVTGPPVNSWDPEISNSTGKTGEYWLPLHLSAPHKVFYHVSSHAGLISYSQKDTT